MDCTILFLFTITTVAIPSNTAMKPSKIQKELLVLIADSRQDRYCKLVLLQLIVSYRPLCPQAADKGSETGFGHNEHGPTEQPSSLFTTEKRINTKQTQNDAWCTSIELA